MKYYQLQRRQNLYFYRNTVLYIGIVKLCTYRWNITSGGWENWNWTSEVDKLSLFWGELTIGQKRKNFAGFRAKKDK